MHTLLIAMKDSDNLDADNLDADNLDTDAEIERVEYSCYVINSVADPLEFPADTCRALVDEDFDGPQTGWQLAAKIRQTKHPMKIIMIVRKTPDIELLPLYDVIWGLPYNFEKIKAEFERRWK